MKPSVISKEYLALQTAISDKQVKWLKTLNVDKVVEKQPINKKNVPIITQVPIHVNYDEYKQWMIELGNFLARSNNQLKAVSPKFVELLTENVVKRWVEEVLAFNQIYFSSFAKEEKLPEWLPYFLAEHSFRPYLRAIAIAYKDAHETMHVKGSCSCCGEPIRMAVLEGKGLKMLICPRCEAKWNQRRLHCTYCGNEDHSKLSYYNIETDKSSKFEVCEKCNSYIKIIDTRKMFKKQSAFLLDVTTLHLDFVAQERGFGQSTEVDEGLKS